MSGENFMAALPSGSVQMREWKKYSSSKEYENTLKWCSFEAHKEGILWAAFDAGYRSGLGVIGRVDEVCQLSPLRETVAERRSTRDVIFERARQERFNGWKAEGFSADHDDGHVKGELVSAALCYLAAYMLEKTNPDAGKAPLQGWFDFRIISSNWPWDRAWFKPSNMRRRLVKALALGLAELDRLDRAEARAKAAGGEHEQ